MNLIIILISILINFQEKDKINIVLNNLHRYASEANGELYFNLFDENAVFFGTDSKERWTIDQFEDYALKRFEKMQIYNSTCKWRFGNAKIDKKKDKQNK